ncbi:MAG: YceD family protein [Pseudomonadota bacterium]|nr:YceD family protein [Pseudomonadota bacterium]
MDDVSLIHLDRLSEKPQVFKGTFSPSELDRLEDSLANGEGELHYTVTARLDPLRRRVVSCTIEGFVFLTCQSSLDAFRFAISVDDRLVLVGAESELPAVEEEDETEDYLVVEESLDIRDVVEDAVLLALPMVPRKPGLDEQAAKGGEVVRKESPFAALASLKKDK